MKYFVVIFLAGGWLSLSACHDKARTDGAAGSTDPLTKDSTANVFFPVGDYLETEILRVDSTPVAIVKYTVEKGRKDSVFISPAEFNALARQFLSPEFGNGSFQKDFQESSFMDKATRSVTFTYSTQNRSLPLQRVDVLAIPSPNRSSNQVKSIYIERTDGSGDTLTLRKMYWKAGQNFQILTRTSVHGQPPIERQLKVVWDNGEEEE
jgi:hypothetical protein